MLQVIFYSLIGGIFSLIGGALLLSRKKSAEGLAIYATPFAAGVLLAAAFTDLIPEALNDSSDATQTLSYVLYGIVVFFLLEKFLRWFHHHHEHEGKEKASNSLVIIGDTLHNALDGVAIGAAFLANPSVGILTTLAVAAHEIPQEIGDFGLMLRNGMSRSKVLQVNIISAFATTITAMLTYTLGDFDRFPLSQLIAITAGFFIYIASSDIIPEIHEKLTKGKRDIRPWLLVIGALTTVLLTSFAHESNNTKNNCINYYDKDGINLIYQDCQK